jgi:uncharacterized protein (TIGR02594 family)
MAIRDHFALALNEIGTREIKGAVNNPRIVGYHQATTLRATDDETPWCASFVCWVLETCGIKSTRSAAARSFENWGQSIELENAEPGDIAVFRRGDKPWQGHVGFFVGEDGDRLLVLGGNQGDRVTISSYPKDQLLSIREV